MSGTFIDIDRFGESAVRPMPTETLTVVCGDTRQPRPKFITAAVCISVLRSEGWPVPSSRRSLVRALTCSCTDIVVDTVYDSA